MKRYRHRLIVALSALNFLSAPLASADPNEKAKQIKEFHNSAYTLCDAKLLSNFWKEDITESKATIGRKLGYGAPDFIDSALDQARPIAQEKGLRCTFAESGFTYDDVELLAGHWNTNNTEVKTTIENKIFWGGGDIITFTLAELRGELPPMDRVPVYEPVNELNAYWEAGLTLCDANLLAKHWSVDVYESKSTAGMKVLAGDMPILQSELAQARAKTTPGNTLENFSCSFYDEGYTYDDIELLAAHWGKGISETKVAVNKKILWGNNDGIQKTLQTLKTPQKGKTPLPPPKIKR